jgi:hypothetical protein
LKRFDPEQEDPQHDANLKSTEIPVQVEKINNGGHGSGVSVGGKTPRKECSFFYLT